MSQADKPTCRHCNETFGNAGAKANHESACPYNPENAPDQHTRQPQGQQAAPPARQPQGEAAPPARRGGGAGVGGTLVDAAIAVADDDLPQEARRSAIRNGLGMVGDAIFRWQEYRERKMEEQDRRAANVELQEVVEYPTCECGYQFGGEDIGLNQEKARCPSCDRLYEIIDVPEEGGDNPADFSQGMDT